MNYEEITYQGRQVVCEHPRLVCSPLLPELVCRYGIGMIAGRPFMMTSMQRKQAMAKFPWQNFSIKKNGITADDIDTSYIVNPATGETYPIYMLVECGQCPICCEKKTLSMVQRCKLETLCYESMPWFITLTYAPKYLPKQGVDLDDCQRYMKRLRINLERAGYGKKIRYVLSSEYGSNGTHRPHYHLIIWNLPAYNTQQYMQVSDIVEKSWNMGNVVSRVMDYSDDKCLYYTCKYVYKKKEYPKGKKPPFFLASNRHGGIGTPWIEAHKEEMHRTLNIKYKYLNKFSGAVKEIVFDRFIINKLFPSWCRQVPSSFRTALLDFSRAYNSLDRLNLFSEKYAKKYKEYAPLYDSTFNPYSDGVPVSARLNENDAVHMMEESMPIIDKYKHIDFSQCDKLATLRNKFVTKLFMYPKTIDVQERLYRARKRYAQSVAIEKI